MDKEIKLKIGIDASRAFIKNRTGIEEYSYQVIKHLRRELKSQQVVLYLRPGDKKRIDFKIPKNWKVKELIWGYFWTQFGLSLELLLHPVDVLFVPAHTLPFIHPRRSYVTVHGLEYEFSPKNYSWRSQLFHRFFIKKSCYWAKKIIAVSEKTKNDLIKLYKINSRKIRVVGNGFDNNAIKNRLDVFEKKIIVPRHFLFFLGRLEERKNVVGIIKTFNILKKKYNYPGKLLLGGSKGYGYDRVKTIIQKSKYQKDIKELGFVNDKNKWIYLQKADVFLFPSLFEGFGIPILEAQSMGAPVITSNYEPMKGVVGDKRTLVNPVSSENIAQVINQILVDKKLREDIIERGLKNIKRFSWQKSAEKIGKILIKE